MIKIQHTDDNECFKWGLVRYLHLTDHNSKRIKKIDKDFAKELGFKDIKISNKISNIGSKNYTGISVFGYEDKERYTIYELQKIYELQLLSKDMSIYYW